MAERTEIEWCDRTWSPWIGCQKVGPGCDHCYAEALNKRTGGGNWGPGAPRRRTSPAYWRQPQKWNRAGQSTVFPSLCDPFDNAALEEWRYDFGDVIIDTPNLTWLLLTKRIGNAVQLLGDMFDGVVPANVIVGATMVNQPEVDRDWNKLMEVKHRFGVRTFASMEPLLGSIEIPPFGSPYIDWVIVGGESGPGARPMHPDWARSLRDQCAAAGVPFLFKQWGEWMPTNSVDIYCHGPDRNRRAYPRSEGVSILADGRTCLRDFSVAEHKRRIAAREATSSRAIEVDFDALNAFHESLDRTEGPINPLGYQWMYAVGKKSAGRLLDGVLHDGYPEGIHHA